ncbi:MAG TPA: hypothetical protein DD490_12160 [Acidobacteria bacterium]|nr:hypothetical protein [Acidobacteriota bacterium]
MLLDRVAEADRREVSRFTAEASRPALLGLTSEPGRGLVAVVARRAVPAPRQESLTLLFRDAGRLLCEVQAVAGDWKKAGGAGSDGPGPGSHPYLRWLRKNNLLGDVYLSEVPLALGACPADELADAEVVLREGDERANRLEM